MEKQYSMIVFDLDGTLAVSKGAMDAEMAQLFSSLLTKYKVSVITGGDYPQFKKQIFPHITQDTAALQNFYVCPTCATKMYLYQNGDWEKQYALDLSEDEKALIIKSLDEAMAKYGFTPTQTWGQLIEDRGSQITLSALGQDAPIEAKATWDPDFAKRLKMKEYLDTVLGDFSVRLGGTTSVDVTKQGVDKAFGIRKLEEVSGVAIADMLFIGDAIFPGGNDYPVVETGVDYQQVADVDATKKIIRELLAAK